MKKSIQERAGGGATGPMGFLLPHLLPLPKSSMGNSAAYFQHSGVQSDWCASWAMNTTSRTLITVSMGESGGAWTKTTPFFSLGEGHGNLHPKSLFCNPLGGANSPFREKDFTNEYWCTQATPCIVPERGPEMQLFSKEIYLVFKKRRKSFL